MTETKQSILLNLTEIRETIFSEFTIAENENQRGSLLGLFCSVVDIAESTVTDPELLKSLKHSREMDYKTMIVEESCIAGNISIDILNAVTLREIAAGRMASDHSLRGIAEQCMAAPHMSPEELIEYAKTQTPQDGEKGGWFRSVFTKFFGKGTG